MSVGEEVEVETKQFQITQDIIYWAIAIASGLILVTLGIVDVIATSRGGDFITILDINDFVILAIIVTVGIPTFLIVLREERRQSRIDENLPYLLREISNAQRTGMSLPRAIQESAKRHYGPLTPELRKMSSKITWGIPFSKAMEDFQAAVDTPLAQRATVLILEAERSGGNLEDIFEATEHHKRKRGGNETLCYDSLRFLYNIHHGCCDLIRNILYSIRISKYLSRSNSWYVFIGDRFRYVGDIISAHACCSRLFLRSSSRKDV
jgi:hypothetical protein